MTTYYHTDQDATNRRAFVRTLEAIFKRSFGINPPKAAINFETNDGKQPVIAGVYRRRKNSSDKYPTVMLDMPKLTALRNALTGHPEAMAIIGFEFDDGTYVATHSVDELAKKAKHFRLVSVRADRNDKTDTNKPVVDYTIAELDLLK